MLGLGDFSVAAAIVGSVAVALFGVIYGTVNWNRGDVPQPKQRRSRGRRRRRHKRARRR